MYIYIYIYTEPTAGVAAATYYYMCPHTTIHVFSYYYICVLIRMLTYADVCCVGTDADPMRGVSAATGAGTQFTCFTGTKVHILTQQQQPQEQVLNSLAFLLQKYTY